MDWLKRLIKFVHNLLSCISAKNIQETNKGNINISGNVNAPVNNNFIEIKNLKDNIFNGNELPEVINLSNIGKKDTEMRKVNVLQANPKVLNLNKDAGFKTIIINTETKWSIYVNDENKVPLITDVSPLNGEGTTSVKVSYRSVNSQHYYETATLVIKYNSWDIEQNFVVELRRINLPK